jgi:hypothetical protein
MHSSSARTISRSSAHDAVLRSVAYAQVFHAPLTWFQLAHYAISPTFIPPVKLWQAWQEMQTRPDYNTNLPDQGKQEFYSPQLRQQKWQAVFRAVQYLRHVPWITSIWVTGSLAVGRYQPDDDIDLMIITKPDTLWISRLTVSLIGLAVGKLRRYFHTPKQSGDRWCCNVWLEQNATQLPRQKQNLYTARELLQAVPVYQARSGSTITLLTTNSWAQKYSANGWRAATERTYQLFSQSPLWHFLPGFTSQMHLVARLLNFLSYRFQLSYMRSHQQRELITRNQAFFHPTNQHLLIQPQYETIVRALLKAWYGSSAQ